MAAIEQVLSEFELRSAIDFDTACTEMPCSRAAEDRLPRFATLTKYLICLMFNEAFLFRCQARCLVLAYHASECAPECTALELEKTLPLPDIQKLVRNIQKVLDRT